jgi:hypothetical protein
MKIEMRRFKVQNEGTNKTSSRNTSRKVSQIYDTVVSAVKFALTDQGQNE